MKFIASFKIAIAKPKGEKQIKELQLGERKRSKLERKQLHNTIGSLIKEIDLLEQNLILYKDNLAICQTRFTNGKINGYELNKQE